MNDQGQRPKERGLFDGFEGYVTPTDDEYRGALRTALVVLDANVLLNLYRYNVDARRDLFSVLEKLEHRLWIPHQVAVEFWRNRESAGRDFQKATQELLNKLGGYETEALQALRFWTNRISLEKSGVDALEERVNKSFEALTDEVKTIAANNDDAELTDTNRDQILIRLGHILSGKVGAPLSREEYERALKEAARRIADQIPPGYQDKGKSGSRPSGDYLVWMQTLAEATGRKSDVILVTGDVKNDWWREERGQTKGPRFELVEELQKIAGVRLFMMRPETLLFHARHALRIAVKDESLKDVERVDRSIHIEHVDVSMEKIHESYRDWKGLARQYRIFLVNHGFSVHQITVANNIGAIVASRDEANYIIYVGRSKSPMSINVDHILLRIRALQREASVDAAGFFPLNRQFVAVFRYPIPASIVDVFTQEQILVAWLHRGVWYGTTSAFEAGLAESIGI